MSLADKLFEEVMSGGRTIATKGGNLMCEPGKIERVGYTRKDRTKVEPVCIKDMGKPGKGPALIKGLNKGELKKYGYENVKNMTEKSRHTALNKAVKEYGRLSVMRKLRAVATLKKNTDPKGAKIHLKDYRYLRGATKGGV